MVPAGALGATPTLSRFAPADPTAKIAWADAQAEYFWFLDGPGILASFHGGVSAGQCTDLIAARRPDVIARVDTSVYVEDLLADDTRPPNVAVNWLAKSWTSDAQHAGLTTGHVPRPNAVMVFQPGAYGAGWGGHVALVDTVNRDGSFTISEEHAPRLGVVTNRHFRRNAVREIAKDRRITFIY